MLNEVPLARRIPTCSSMRCFAEFTLSEVEGLNMTWEYLGTLFTE
jgi:hypothetical protein